MKKLSDEEIKIIQLSILKNVADFCSDNNIRYSLCGGTLLGAVRHKGYIPWDDDIDIMMPRPDYMRFLKEYRDISGNFCSISIESDIKFPFLFAKVYDKRTIITEKGATRNIGVNIDVFPVEGVPEEEKELKKYWKKVILAIRLSQHRNYPINKFSIRIFTKFFLRVLPKKIFYRMLNSFYTDYNFNNYNHAGAVIGLYGQREIHKKEIFENYIELKFENSTFQAIKEYDKYLTQNYGDYMKFPPKEEQINKHGIIAYKLERFLG